MGSAIKGVSPLSWEVKGNDPYTPQASMRKPHLEGVIEKETEKMITKSISIGIGQSDWN